MRTPNSRAPRFRTAFCEKENELCPSTARGWGLGGSPEGDRRGLSLVGARRHGAVVRAAKSLRGHLKGESLESLSRRHGVTAAKLSQWRDDFVAGGEARLKHREVAVEGADTRRLKSVVADLATDKALLAEKIRHLEAGRPLGWWRSRNNRSIMAGSPTTSAAGAAALLSDKRSSGSACTCARRTFRPVDQGGVSRPAGADWRAALPTATSGTLGRRRSAA